MDERNYIQSINISTIKDNKIGDVWIDTTTMNDCISIDDTINISGISIKDPVEFEDYMPDVAKIEDMCKDYPALEKAYENFKTVYKMVHQDWKGRQDVDDSLHY